MKIDINELKKEDLNITEVNKKLGELSKSIDAELENIKNSVRIESVVETSNNLRNSISNSFKVINEDITRIQDFMNSQLKKYEITAEEASKELSNLIRMLDLSFDVNGNVNKQVLKTFLNNQE